MPDPRSPSLDEFVLEAGGDPFNFAYIEALYSALSQNYETTEPQQAFAPPLPEVIVSPPPPPPPAPPRVPAPVIIETAPGLLTRLLPFFGLAVPLPSGPPGTGDAPDEPSTVVQRYADTPPPPPPPIDLTFAEPELPPNWMDIANRPFEGDPIRVPGIPIPYPDVVMPIGEPEFILMPPQPSPRPSIDIRDNPLPAGTPYDFPDFIGAPAPDFAPYPGPGPAPTPFSPPRIDPAPGLPDPFAPPGTRGIPDAVPFNPTAPDVFGAPLPDLIGDPIGDPLPAPDRKPSPRPEPGKPVPDVIPGTPLDFFTPVAPSPRDTVVPIDPIFASPDPFDSPTPLIDPEMDWRGPTKKPDQCQCDKPKKKKKQKKPARTVCFRGTYRQLRKGISYTKQEEVPCEDKAPRKRTSSRKPKTPTWNDTLRDVFQLPT